MLLNTLEITPLSRQPFTNISHHPYSLYWSPPAFAQ